MKFIAIATELVALARTIQAIYKDHGETLLQLKSTRAAYEVVLAEHKRRLSEKAGGK